MAGATTERRVLPLLLWAGSLAAAIALLLAVGGGRLAGPTLTAPGTWADWAATRETAVVVGVTLRLLALGLAWYLVGVTSIAVLARLLRAARLVRVADALSVGPVRALAQQAVGVGLATSVLVTAVPGAPASTVIATRTVPEAATVRVSSTGDDVGAAAATTPGATPGAVAGDRPAAPVPAPALPVPGDEPHATTDPGPTAAPEVAPAPAVTSPPASTPDATVAPVPAGTRSVRVEPGDHLWSLSEADVAAHLGRAPTEAEIVVHWRRVVEANAAHLRVPGNPDFLVPGQQVLLPEVELGGVR